MGYNTEFRGILEFKNPLTDEEVIKLSTFLGEDCRDHPEWDYDAMLDLTYIDLKFSDDYDGLIWDGSEKTYDMVEKINLILKEMRKEFPDFDLEGELMAYGEEPGDIWKIVMEDGYAITREVEYHEKPLVCPHCRQVIENDSYSTA